MQLKESTGVPGANECRTLRDGSPCLLGVERRQEWTCRVCRSILEWRRNGSWECVFVRETGPRAAYVFPGNAEQDGSSCILQLDFNNTADREIRRIVNFLLMAMVAVSIYDCEADGPLEIVNHYSPKTAGNDVRELVTGA